MMPEYKVVWNTQIFTRDGRCLMTSDSLGTNSKQNAENLKAFVKLQSPNRAVRVMRKIFEDATQVKYEILPEPEDWQRVIEC